MTTGRLTEANSVPFELTREEQRNDGVGNIISLTRTFYLGLALDANREIITGYRGSAVLGEVNLVANFSAYEITLTGSGGGTGGSVDKDALLALWDNDTGDINLATSTGDATKVAATIEAGAADTTELADDAVTNDKLAANAVTNDKLAANAVTSSKIGNGQVQTQDLSDLVNTRLHTDAEVQAFARGELTQANLYTPLRKYVASRAQTMTITPNAATDDFTFCKH